MRVPMRAHPERRSLLAAAVEELAGVLQPAPDETLGAGEVGRRDCEPARRRQHNHARIVPVTLDVVDQAALGEQTERAQRRRRAPRAAIRPARQRSVRNPAFVVALDVE